MPSLKYEDYKKKAEQGKAFSKEDYLELSEVLRKTRQYFGAYYQTEELEDKLYDIEIQSGKLAADGPLESRKKYLLEDGLEKLGGFSEFLKKVDPLTGKTNYDKIDETLRRNDPDLLTRFRTSMQKLSDAAGLELDLTPSVPGPARRAPGEIFTAEEYTRDLRDHAFQKKESLTEEEKADYADNFLRMMAARMLAGSKRNDKSLLEMTRLGEDAIEEQVRRMKKDPTFQSFTESLKDDPALMKQAIAAAAKKPGHGGGLDDMFKAHITNLPAHQLRNNALLSRWMPTVKERIEALKAKAADKMAAAKEYEKLKEKLDRMDRQSSYDEKERQALMDKMEAAEERKGNLYDEASEILILRNMVKADRGHKASLDKPVPVSERDTLEGRFYRAKGDKKFAEALENEETAKLIAKGHGGALIDEIRKGGVPGDYRTIGRELYAGSVQTRIEELKADAKTAAARLKASPDDPETADKAKDILSEYLMLDFMTRDKATNQIDQAKLLTENVPYGKIEEMKQSGPGNNPMFRKMVGSISGQQAAELMEDMAEKGQGEFMGDLMQRKVRSDLQEQNLPKKNEAEKAFENEMDHIGPVLK